MFEKKEGSFSGMGEALVPKWDWDEVWWVGIGLREKVRGRGVLIQAAWYKNIMDVPDVSTTFCAIIRMER